MSFEQTEDLKAFERRLTEVIDKLQPAARFWRIILIFVSVCTAAGAWTWLWDPETTHVSFVQSLWNHPFFTISCITLFTLFLFGIHKRVVAPSIFSLLPFILKLFLPQLFYFISSFSSHSPKFDHLFSPTPFSDWKTNSFKTQAIYMTVGILVIHLPLFDQDFCLFKQLKN